MSTNYYWYAHGARCDECGRGGDNPKHIGTRYRDPLPFELHTTKKICGFDDWIERLNMRCSEILTGAGVKVEHPVMRAIILECGFVLDRKGQG